MKKIRALTSMIVVLALLTGCSSGCATGSHRRVATVSVVTAHATLSAIQDGEILLVCGRPTAPAQPMCVPIEVHREISKKLERAFALDKQVAELVRATPPGVPQPADVPILISEISSLIDEVLRSIPDSPQKESLSSSLENRS